MPSSMWRPPGVSCQCTRVCGSSANQSRRSPTDQIPDLLIQPPRLVELATSGLTVTTRSATSGASCTRSTKKRPNACCVDSLPRCFRPSAGGTSGGGRRGGLALPAAWVERGPRVVSVRAERIRELGELLDGEERRVVLRMPLDRERPALDRVGEDHGRAIVLHRPVRLDQLADVVAAEIAEGAPQLVVGQVADERL